MALRRFIFDPLTVLVTALSGSFLYALYVTFRFPGGDLSHHYVYVVPIVAPFIAFLFDRAERFRNETVLQNVLDLTVVGAAMMRMMAQLPLISGHALFLTYAVVRPGSRLTRVMAGAVLIETIYLKVFVWHDPISPAIGSILALTAGLVCAYENNQLTKRVMVNIVGESPAAEPRKKSGDRVRLPDHELIKVEIKCERS